MSCNGCRVLRKGCSDSCILRPCLQWIEGAEAQGHATVFVAKFFGRAGLMSFISAVPENQRPALFRSLLYEACGRTVNPVYGAVGLLWSGNWQICQSAVETVLRGGIVRALPNPVMASSIPNNKAFSDQAKIALPDLKMGDPNLLHLEKPVAVKAETLELEDFSDFTHKGIESVQKMDKKQQIHQIWEASGRRVRHHLGKIDENGYGDTSVIDLDLTLCSHPHKKGLQLPSSSCCNSVSSSEGSVTSLDTGDAMSVFALHNRPKMLPLLQKMEPL